MSQNWISFPNLGVTFNLNPVAFTIGSFQVQWSLIFSVIAAAVGILLFFKAVSKQSLDKKQVITVTAVTAFSALIGARLFFVVPQNLWLMDQYYQISGNYPDSGYYNTFYKVIAFFDKDYAGLNLFGGLIFGLIVLAILCKVKKWSLSKYLDSLIYALPASFAINALGYITDQSSFGQHSNSLLAINGSHIQELVYDLYQSSVVRGGAAVGPNVKWVVGKPVSPTPIYEILGCIAIILIVWLISKFVIFSGEKFLWSMGLYGVLRAVTENSRIDALLFWNMRVNVLFSIITAVVCAVLVFIIRWQVREGRLRSISRYVDPRKNDGFENDTFIQKIYRGEAADVVPNTASDVAPGEAADETPENTASVVPDAAVVRSDTTPGEADAVQDKPADSAPGEPDSTPEPEQTGGKGQVWTADNTDDETPDDHK